MTPSLKILEVLMDTESPFIWRETMTGVNDQRHEIVENTHPEWRRFNPNDGWVHHGHWASEDMVRRAHAELVARWKFKRIEALMPTPKTPEEIIALMAAHELFDFKPSGRVNDWDGRDCTKEVNDFIEALTGEPKTPWSISSDGRCAVSNTEFYRPMNECPLNVKLQLLSPGGTHTQGTVFDESWRSAWLGWAPLPRVRK